VTYGYDAAGNTTSKTENAVTTTYIYNAEGRLSRIEDANQAVIAEYKYDPLGRRYRKVTQSETVYFYYTDEGLVGEFNAAGGSIRQYGFEPDSTWTTSPLYQKTSQGYAYYRNDHLGTPQQLVSKSGSKVWNGEYLAFGGIKAESGTWENRLRFPGQYFDQETNNYYNYFRDYDPTTGMYLQSDPIGLKGGLNTYSYVGGSPLSHTDPFGLVKWRGRFDYLGFDLGIGIIGWDFYLVSECINNIAYYAHIDATAVQVSGGSPVGIGMSSPWDFIEINDTSNTPNPFNLHGGFSFGGAGHSIGSSTSGGVKVQLGGGIGTYNGAMDTSFDFGGAGGGGGAEVVSFEEISFPDSCACEQWNQEQFGN
jgi:RHS repeat-associated protein